LDSGQHELNRFFEQAAALMRLEYERIHANASKDPGTAGDEGEENWREFLAGWLPPAYHVVTKGQLINTDGELSPQVDVLVLDPTYPPHLRHVKKYLADLVVAAFECKLTLRKPDITKTVDNAKKIRQLFKPRKGNLYKEVYSPIVYGLLAHTQELASDTQRSAFKIAQTLYECDEQIIEHPREVLDFVCVSDLITISRATQGYLHFNDGLFFDISRHPYVEAMDVGQGSCTRIMYKIRNHSLRCSPDCCDDLREKIRHWCG